MVNGNFEVYEDGTILKILKDGTKIAPKSRYYKYRNKEYAVVRYTENSKTRSVYVHRLLAEAFLPNPDNKRFVLFKNDDPRDLRVENLMWDDGTLMLKRRSDKKCLEKTKCPECGKMININIVCLTCQKQKAAFKKEQEKLEKIIKRLAKIELEYLDEETQKAIQMRREGKTYTEIAKELGKSYQNVYYLVENARKTNSSRTKRKYTSRKKSGSTNKKYEIPFSTGKTSEEERSRRMFIFGKSDR